MSSYCAFPISKVLGLIAAINPIMTAGIPGVREARKNIVVFSPIISREFFEECLVDFNSLKGYTVNELSICSFIRDYGMNTEELLYKGYFQSRQK